MTTDSDDIDILIAKLLNEYLMDKSVALLNNWQNWAAINNMILKKTTLVVFFLVVGIIDNECY